MSSLHERDLSVICCTALEAVILEIGTNDPSYNGPEVVGSDIEDLVCFLMREFGICVVCVCHVIPRGLSCRGVASFKVQTLHKVLPPDGVHLNSLGQYILYQSYRGAILKALSMLHKDTTR